jgi:ABC-type nitrate/sulfonate/bicarbonate transport system substrate-binding protein
MESITIGGAVSDSGTLIFIADDQHFFAMNGINVTQKDYDTGLTAIVDLLNNEIDFARAGEYPVVGKAFENAGISIVVSHSRSFNEYMVGPGRQRD